MTIVHSLGTTTLVVVGKWVRTTNKNKNVDNAISKQRNSGLRTIIKVLTLEIL